MTININKTCKVINGCTPTDIPSSVFESSTPIILKGLVKKWPITQKQNDPIGTIIKQLKQFYNGRPAPTYFAESDIEKRLAYDDKVTQLNFVNKPANINEVIDELVSFIGLEVPPLRYIASTSVDLYFPELRTQNDISFNNDYFHSNPLNKLDPMVGIWIGNQTIVPCHFDGQNNIACCIAGNRKFTLFPPEQIENLYPGPLSPTPGGQPISMVDFAKPDFEQYPKFKTALEHREIAELEPGDAIFIPALWWHQVESLSDFNTLINYWWDTMPRINGQAMDALLHAILSIRDRSGSEKQAWQHLFNYYVFDDKEKAGKHLPDEARGALGPVDELQGRRLRAMIMNKLNR